MAHTPNELSEEFPQFTTKIHALKTNDPHFLKLHEEYHEVNKQVHRAETDVEPTSDEHLADLRKTRLVLKDEIFALLTA